jgi:hypothetical protein
MILRVPRPIARPIVAVVSWLAVRFGAPPTWKLGAITPSLFTLAFTELPPQVVVHEVVGHQGQVRARMPTWGPRWLAVVIGTLRYQGAWWWGTIRFGYWGNPLEVEARRVAGEDP